MMGGENNFISAPCCVIPNVISRIAILHRPARNALIQIKAFHFLTNAVDGPIAEVPSAASLVKIFAEGATAKTLKPCHRCCPACVKPPLLP
jgi:hypothetical protein